MYLGKIVEIAGGLEIYKNPRHPYTKALMSAILVPDPHQNQSEVVLKGDIPSSIDLPKGCGFSPSLSYCYKGMSKANSFACRNGKLTSSSLYQVMI